MKRPCDPAAKSGHDFRAVLYVGELPFAVVCRRCGRCVGLGPSGQHALKFETTLMPEMTGAEQPVAH